VDRRRTARQVRQRVSRLHRVGWSGTGRWTYSGSRRCPIIADRRRRGGCRPMRVPPKSEQQFHVAWLPRLPPGPAGRRLPTHHPARVESSRGPALVGLRYFRQEAADRRRVWMDRAPQVDSVRAQTAYRQPHTESGPSAPSVASGPRVSPTDARRSRFPPRVARSRRIRSMCVTSAPAASSAGAGPSGRSGTGVAGVVLELVTIHFDHQPVDVLRVGAPPAEFVDAEWQPASGYPLAEAHHAAAAADLRLAGVRTGLLAVAGNWWVLRTQQEKAADLGLQLVPGRRQESRLSTGLVLDGTPAEVVDPMPADTRILLRLRPN